MPSQDGSHPLRHPSAYTPRRAQNSQTQPSYADILAGRTDFDFAGRQREQWDGEADVDRFEHLDDMSDRPTLGQGSGEEIERGANGGSGDGGGTRGARSPQDGAGDSPRAASSPPAVTRRPTLTHVSDIPVITLDQLLDPDFRLSATRHRPSPSVSPRDLSGTAYVTNTGADGTGEAEGGLMVASGEAGDEAASGTVGPMSFGSGTPGEGSRRTRGSSAAGAERSNAHADGADGVSGDNAPASNGTTSNGAGDRRTPWRRMFLHPNGPIYTNSATTPDTTAPTDPSTSSTGNTASAGTVPRRRSVVNPAPGPRPEFVWHANRAPSAASAPASASANGTGPSRRQTSTSAAPAATSTGPTQRPSARNALFTEQDYLDSFPGLATFAEDAHLDFGMALDPNTEPDVQDDTDLYSWLLPGDSYIEVPIDSRDGSVGPDVEAEMEARREELLAPSNARPRAGTGGEVGEEGADLARGGNNRRRVSLRRTAATNAGASASASASTSTVPSHSSPLAVSRNAAGQTTYAGRPAVTSQEILAWQPARPAEERAGRLSREHSPFRRVSSLLDAWGRDGSGGRGSQRAVRGGDSGDMPAGMRATNMDNTADAPMVVRTIGARAQGGSRGSRVRHRSASSDVMAADGAEASAVDRSGADERNKRPRLGNISPSPHEDPASLTAVPSEATARAATGQLTPSYLAYYPHVPASMMPSTFAPPVLSSNLAISTSHTPSSIPNHPSPATPSTHPPCPSRLITIITFTAHPAPTRTDEDATALLTSLPIPPALGLYYYEVTVTGSGPEGYMSVGFMKGDSDTNRLVGWDRGTWGYHADDGLLFEGSGKGRPFGEVWGVGDTVGAGIDFTTKRVFFTKNGKLLGTGIVPIVPSLHPAVALRNVGEQLEVNLSGPFAYDIDRSARTLKDRALESVFRHRVDKVMPMALLSYGSDGTANGVPKNARARASRVLRTTSGYDAVVPEERYKEMNNVGCQAGMEMALVLEYLAHKGMDEVAGLMNRDIRQRGLFDGHKSARGTGKEEVGAASDKGGAKGKGRDGAETELSIGARYRSVITSASRHPLQRAYEDHVDKATQNALSLEPRLLIIDFVYMVLRSLPGAEALPSSSPWSLSHHPEGSSVKGDDTHNTGHPTDARPDLGDILEHGRHLQSIAKSWDTLSTSNPIPDIPDHLERHTPPQALLPSKYLQEAFGLLALSHPLPAEVERTWIQRRQAWMAELHDAIRVSMGMGRKSLLGESVEGLGEVMRTLREKGDGWAACVKMGDVMGDRAD